MQQHLKLKAFFPFVAHVEHRLQATLAQRATIHQAEVLGPCFIRLFADLCGRQAEVEFHRIVSAFTQRPGLGGRFAEILPLRVSGEAVLWQLPSCVVFWWWAEALFTPH